MVNPVTCLFINSLASQYYVHISFFLNLRNYQIYQSIYIFSRATKGLVGPNSLHCLKTKRLVGRAVTHSSWKREVRVSSLGPVKSDTVLPTAHHRCDISSKGAVVPGRNDAEMGPANLLHASGITASARKDLM